MSEVSQPSPEEMRLEMRKSIFIPVHAWETGQDTGKQIWNGSLGVRTFLGQAALLRKNRQDA